MVLCWSLFWYALLSVLSYFVLLSFGCFYCTYVVALAHGAIVWSAVCDCGISRSGSKKVNLGPDWGPKCLQRLSAGVTSKQSATSLPTCVVC